MFQNYLKTSLRNLIRHRFFSAINIIGLAVAMSICMALIMLVADQMSYDRYNTKHERIFRVTTVDALNNDQPNSASPMTLRQELMEKYTGIEKTVRILRGFGNGWLEFENQDVNIPFSGFYADPEIFDLFEYEFQYGDAATALTKPYSVVLTRRTADKLFKEENPVGLTMKVKESIYSVTGVLKETDKKSHVVFEALASMATVKSRNAQSTSISILDDWTNYWNGWTYVLLEPAKSSSDIQPHLDKIYQERIAVITDPDIYKMEFSLQALTDITPGDFMNNPIGPSLPWVFVYFTGGLALVILLTSCFNFTNLSIARSLTRAREIGVRKVTGAARWQIFVQFLSESVLVSFMALVIALVLLLMVKPLILQLNFARIFHWDLQANFMVYGLFVLFAIVVGIMAGLFPAVVLSGFEPVKVLKSLSNVKMFSRIGLRKALLISQFTLSLFFILSVIVMYNQLKLFTSQHHGFNAKSNIMLRLNNTPAFPLKAELLKYKNITAVSAVSHVPAAGVSNGNQFKKAMDEKEWTDLGIFQVDEDYIKNMEVDLIAGKFFSEELGQSNKNYLVINNEAVKKFGYATPTDAIGQELFSRYDSARKTIIGVVQDYNHRDLTRAISPLALLYDSSQFSILQIRYADTYENASQTVEKAWAVVNPGLKVDYKEVESEIKKFYEFVFGDIVKILGVIAFLAILISCLGLLGMATYSTETRIKEISIRKILGSSGYSLVVLLSKGYLMVIATAILIGVPAAFFVNNLWLELIAYHTSIDLSVIAIGVSILILFGVLTIGSQTIRATFVKPVDNLKSE
jgi:putative ABC transport system permease protein